MQRGPWCMLKMPLYGGSLQDLSYSGGEGPEEPVGVRWEGPSEVGGNGPLEAENALVWHIPARPVKGMGSNPTTVMGRGPAAVAGVVSTERWQ